LNDQIYGFLTLVCISRKDVNTKTNSLKPRLLGKVAGKTRIFKKRPKRLYMDT